MFLINPHRFGVSNPFIFTVTVVASEVIPLPLESSGTYNFVVNYGDGGWK